MNEIQVNIAMRPIPYFRDSAWRSDHIFNRMQMRGITTDHIKEAVQKGLKCIRQDRSIIAEYRWFKIVYREFWLHNIRKIYPITVLEA